MYLRLLILLFSFLIIHGRHFNGGTITWAPVDPYDNSSSVDITITQSYAWTYPLITCATNVPISTSGRSTQYSNLTCVVDCSTDGGYSTQPINMLTDCTSVSSSLGMLNSERSHNITLTAGAHFYLANVGSAWAALDSPAQSGLQWSIVTFIDLRMRPDGFINTQPVASVVSPQYAIVNRTIQINIPASDVNAGDDVRCRWSTYTAGYRRRKRSDKKEHINQQSAVHFYKEVADDGEIIHVRKRRSCSNCFGGCPLNCPCDCNQCDSTTCPIGTCTIFWGCSPGYSVTAATTITAPKTTTTTTATKTTTTTAMETTTITTASSTTVETTTIETQGTLKSTSSYPHRQAIDECGGICFPNTTPNSTTLSNCTISFTGLVPNTWYAVALQVEDFINDTSTTPMSSVPVQFLIYVLPTPNCSKAAIILPVNGCLEVQANVPMIFNLSAMNVCNPNVSVITDIIVSSGITGMVESSLQNSTTNTSLSYVTFTWTPLANQVGLQQLCTIAFTSEKIQSNQYCITFTVKMTSDLCFTTTTTSTTTTSETTTTTTVTTTTTSTTTTSETTTTTSVTTTTTTTSTTSTSTSTSTTTSSTSTSSTTSTSTTSTTTSTTSTSTSTTTSSTSTSSTTSTSTTSTTTSTTSTSTSTTTTSVTTTTATTTTTTTARTTTQKPGRPIDWLLILGLSLLALLLALCCSCFCLYRFLWSPAARRRRRRNVENPEQRTLGPRNLLDKLRKTRSVKRIHGKSTASNDYLVDAALHANDNMTSNSPSDLHISLSDVNASASVTAITDADENRIPSTVSVKRIRRSSIASMNNAEKLNDSGNVGMKPQNHRDNSESARVIQRSAVTVIRVNKGSTLDETDKNQNSNSNVAHQETSSAQSTLPSKTNRVNVIKIPRKKTAVSHQPRASSVENVSTINLGKASTGMRPMTDHSTTGSRTMDGKAKTDNVVTVTKVPRSLTTSQSRRS